MRDGDKSKLIKISALDILILVSAAFAIICYLFYLIGGTALSDSGGLFISVLIISVSSLPIIFRNFLKKLLGKGYGVLKIIYCVCLMTYMVLFLTFSAIVIIDTESDIVLDQRQTVVIVCGCRIEGDRPSKALQNRLDKALEVLNKDKNAICIVSGGKGDDEITAEANVMADYLAENGIDRSRIIKEDSSRNTVQNIKYSIAIMKEHGLPDNSNVICVSSDFHTARVTMLARINRLDASSLAAPSPYPHLLFASLVREFMSYFYYFIFGG